MTALPYLYGAVLGIIAAVPGAVAIRRQRSGSIRTSEAETLWTVVTAHGERLEREVEQRRKETEECKEDLAGVRAEVRRLKALVGEA